MRQLSTRRTSRRLPPDLRRLVLDEDINWKLAKELRCRGMRYTTTNHELELLKAADTQLIKALAEQHEPCVLVSWDNKMVRSHAQALDHFGLTLAVVDRYADRGDLTEEEYYREVIHRWAHRMTRQDHGSILKYSRTRATPVELRVSSSSRS